LPLLGVNRTKLYHEVRGEGPAVLLIMGMTGDSGHFDALAELLADEFTVVTYDRRGNGRSPRPPGWDTTSPREQADDAAALLAALGLVPAAVYGSSAGANFALSMMLRHPEAVSRAVLHEAVLVRLFDDPEARAGVTALVREAMQAGGAPAALERLWRYVAGDENWERLEPGLRERMAASAETFFDVELGTYEDFLPANEALAAITAPVLVLFSEDSLPVYAQAAGRLASRFGVEAMPTPGSHTSYHDHPRELANTIRPFLRDVSGATE
jgi:pimeloyl-ACP methyl ester carboxylesterase